MVVQESPGSADDDIVMADETVSEDEDKEDIDNDTDILKGGSGGVEQNGALTVISQLTPSEQNLFSMCFCVAAKALPFWNI